MSVLVFSASAVGPTPPQRLEMKAQNWSALGVSALLNFSGGGPAVGNVTVQISNDPSVMDNSLAVVAAARWNNHDLLTNVTGDKNSSIVFPVAYVRLLVNSLASGTVKFFVGIPDQI